MPSSDPRLKTGARRRLRERVASLRQPCHKCGREIDYSGPWDLDEIVPRVLGGDPLDPGNVAASHVRCNREAGARITHARRGFTKKRTTSYDW